MSTVKVPCYSCCYCKTGETQYCTSPRFFYKGQSVSCKRCCYCRTGEEQYCLNPTKC